MILFDIDGTLVHSGGAGKRSMILAFREVYGAGDVFDGISMAGKTDTAILREAFVRLGLDWDLELVERFKESYFRRLQQEIETDTPRKRIMPGVRRVLQELKARDSFALGLLTGNWRKSGYIKLRHFGLDGYFPFGAFADDSEDRNELLPFALRRARQITGRPVRPEETWLIGDTVRDVECGTIHGARVLGVGTGNVPLCELEEAGASAVLPDLSDPEQVVSILSG